MSETLPEAPPEETEIQEQEKAQSDESALRLEALEKRAQTAEKELEKLRRERMSDDERKDTERKEALDRAEKAENALKRARVESIAARLNAVDPEAVASLLPELPEESSDIEASVKRLLKDKPYLVKQVEQAGGADGGKGFDSGTGPTSFSDTLRRGFQKK